MSSVQYPVMESFYTLQGEGYFQGHAAHFIRLGGCDVGCHWCDVKESWPMEAHPLRSVEDLVLEAQAQAAKLVVITGGEPLMHDLFPLTQALQAAGIRTHIETSGVGKWTGHWDWVCFSPKKFKAPNPEVYASVNELKVVVYHPSDLEWAQGFVPELPSEVRLYVQPEWSKQASINPLLVDFVKANPAWRLGLQTHKFLDIP